MRSLFVPASAGVLALCGIAAGDLTERFSAVGNVGGELAAVPFGGGSEGAGSLTLGRIPDGAQILHASLYTNGWFGPSTPAATFAGQSLGSTPNFRSDGNVYAYRWDVTDLVTGSGDYEFRLSGSSQIYFAGLAVVFEHNSLPISAVLLNDGASEMVNFNNASTSLPLLETAGQGNLWLVTQADNALGETNEVISFNGQAVGGPIDANLGDFASLFEIPVSTVSGDNVASISTQQDQFGWHIAMLESPVPSPATGSVLALAGLAAARRRR